MANSSKKSIGRFELVSSIKIFLLVSLTGGLFILLEFAPAVNKTAIIVLSVALILNVLIRKPRLKIYDSFIFLPFIFVVILTTLMNESSWNRTYSLLLPLIAGFVIYQTIMNTRLTEKQMKDINKFIFIIVLFQFPITLYKVLTIGTMEKMVGSFHYVGGSLNTIIPLCGVSFMIALYKFYNPRKIYLFAIFTFLFMSWAGDKRGIYFYLTIVLFIIYYFYNKSIGKNIFQLAKLHRLVFLTIVPAVILFYLGAKLAPTLNPEGKVGGSFDINYILDYAFTYSTQTSHAGEKSGRYSGLLSIVESIMMFRDMKGSLIGYGPQEIIGVEETDFYFIKQTYNVSESVGIIGIATYIIMTGFLGAFFVISIYFKFTKKAYYITRQMKDGYWRAIAFGTFLIGIVFLLDTLTYSRSSLMTIPTNVFFFYLLGIINYQHINNSQISLEKNSPKNI